MNLYQIKNKKNNVYGAILLESIIKKKNRKRIRKFLFYIMIFSFLLMFVSFLSKTSTLKDIVIFIEIAQKTYLFRAIFIFSFSLWLYFYLLEIMYLSFYFNSGKIDFEVLKMSHEIDPTDITGTFLNSDLGFYSMVRLGITKNKIDYFLKNRTEFVTESEYEIVDNEDDEITFSEFGYSLIHFDSGFKILLKENGVTPKDFKEALDWVSRIDKRIKDAERWWTKERLDRMPSIGKNWSFGKIYYLERFGHSILKDESYYSLGDKFRIYTDTVERLENVLIKKRGANAILISRFSDFSMDVVASLGKKILDGTTLSELENKRIYVLDVNVLVSAYDQKNDFEIMLQNILYQSANAGNVILVIPKLSDFVENTQFLKTDVKDLLGEVMSSTNINIIALTSNRGFYEVLETDLDLMKNFEKIFVQEIDTNKAIELIEDEVLIKESLENLFFTYQSIKAIIESADRYFSESSLSDKAIDILEEITSYCVERKISFITEQTVSEIVKEKTGIPLGVLSKKEKAKLSNIESLIKKRIIGQDDAVKSISNSIKRSRVGVADPKKPLGTFLFIGPTGVGKTETAKALAESFFDDEEKITRIDMSEFSDSKSLTRLIGDNYKTGILSAKTRENQYGVLLLDEFEKANAEVHDLFLQILDEGFFSDGSGEKVNARNLIIIATSNAVSELIYDTLDEKINSPEYKEKMINLLINSRVFKPEFLNRFDEIIFFNRLGTDSLKEIVSLMINGLNDRLENKGIDVQISNDLIDYLVLAGQNKKFGAREINRVIQNKIESKVADAFISGEIQKGDTISFIKNNKELEIIKIS